MTLPIPLAERVTALEAQALRTGHSVQLIRDGRDLAAEDLTAVRGAVGELREEAAEAFRLVTDRFTAVDTRLERIDTRLDGLDTRLDGLDTRLERLEADVTELKTGMAQVVGMLSQLIGQGPGPDPG